MSEPTFVPTPCTSCGGDGGGGPFADTERNLLCDTLADGTVVGTALAVYVYDELGNPVGAPTFVDPATGTPYVVQGTLMTCPGETGCLEPTQFCFTSTASGPVDHPGRQYDLTLPINPGFAVQSMNVDAVNHAGNIVWGVDDPDGEGFRAELTTFIEARVPTDAVVTITNPNAGTPQVCGTAVPMTIHIECIRLDQSPPNLIELVYNGGQDLIQNPAYNESPALNPPVSQGNYGFRLLSRQDDPGPFPGNQPANDALCTNIPNRGWETNDTGRTFEIWGQDIVLGSNVTPTPRGTPVQEITSDGPPPGGTSTIWQTFQAPATGNFVIRVVHGARDAGEVHRITLDNGDTDDAQNGDLIDDTTNPGVVTNSPGGPGPWTTFTQTIPLTAGLVYTLSLSSTNPVGGARGGLFTDMRAYLDQPDLRATATTDDDTCVVTVEETTTTTECQLWSPLCEAGDITAWKNAETGATLTNAAFWGQTPSPECCTGEAAGGGGGSVAAGNLVHFYEICGVLGGVPTTLVRVVYTDQSGGVLASTIIGADGGPVAPGSWVPGGCPDETNRVSSQVLCDFGTTGPPDADGIFNTNRFLRTFTRNATGTLIGTADTDMVTGAPYTPIGVLGVGSCGALDFELQWFCDLGNLDGPGGTPHIFWRDYEFNTESGSLFSQNARDLNTNDLYAVIGPQVPYPCGGLSARDTQVIELCDVQPGGGVVTFLRVFTYDDSGNVVSVENQDANGAPYVPTGTSGPCATIVRAQEILCDDNGPFLRVQTSVGGIPASSEDVTLDGVTPYVTVGTVGVCAESTVSDTRDAELQLLCDATPTRFLRKYLYDGETGAFVGIVNTTLDGNTPFAPVGAVGICSTPVVTDLDFAVQQLCDDNGPFLRRFTFNSTTGAVTTIANTNLAGVNYAPVGTVGSCEVCCPIVLNDELCTNTGSGLGTAIRNANGTITLIDSVSGAAILAANVVPCTRTLNAQARLLAASTSWTPGGDVIGVLTGVSATVLTGTATVTDSNGTVVAAIPAGASLDWQVEDANTLTGPQSIAADAASTVLVSWTQR